MNISSGKVYTFRLVIPDDANSFQVPVDINKVLLRNVGEKDLRFNFDGDDPNDYFTIKAGEILPTSIMVQGGENFNTDGVGGATTLEIVAWG